ncbi:lysophospholipid acyltransferase 2-like [Saccostrea echinata]|uniref:lysophospholipid acyltransferase 2-like n=1 Tax=Saccostrea echinata TaxID=191078 RepID=UPI002A81D779|nr:lysophospholipid acyltransferase 2-like [Saccostrea echinata]
MVQRGEFYVGSRLLQPLTVIGLPLDQINFLVCQISALFLGYYFRKNWSPKQISLVNRHALELVVGFILTAFCFGYQVIHVVLMGWLCYALILHAPRDKFHVLVFISGMGYLCIMHMYRQYYDYEGYSLDITGPLMILTQKVTSIAFPLHDGTQKKDEDLNPDQRIMKIEKPPSVLEYFSYLFSFHNIMVGPLVFYTDYIKFIEGKDGSYETPDKTPTVPHPEDAVKEKLMVAGICGVVMVLSPLVFPVEYMADEEFLYQTNWFYRNFFVLFCVSLVRAKYYCAWKLGEAVNNAAGLGFSGYDDKGQAKWDLLNNVKIYELEVSNSLKVNIDCWNITTLIWLRRVVYDRVPPKHRTLATFMVSALWHGFYPGYYICFTGAALCTVAARLMRRNVRPLFLDSPDKKKLYDAGTFFFTRFANVYLASNFCLLGLVPCFSLLGSLYFWIHLCAIAVIIYFSYLHPKKKTEKVETVAKEIVDVKKSQ